jgi:hypothetical protein
VAEGDEAAKPQCYVEADTSQRQDDGAGGERDEERLVGKMRDQRSAEQDQRQDDVETMFGDEVLSIGGKQPLWLEDQHNGHQKIDQHRGKRRADRARAAEAP